MALHIGYRKTGSTWLQNVVFRGHGELGLIPRYPLSNPRVTLKNDHLLGAIVMQSDRQFDAAKTRSRLITRVEEWADQGATHVLISAERLSGHGASGGYDSIRIAHRLHATLPEAKVFWFVRDQVAAIRAEYKQMVIEGWPASFRSTVETEPSWSTTSFDLGHWEYHHLVEVYHRLFGSQNVRVFDYSRLQSNAAEVLVDLAQFLGIDAWQLSDREIERRVNVSATESYLASRRLLNRFRRSDLNPHPAFTMPGRLRSNPRLIGAVSRFIRSPLIPDDFDRAIGPRYVDSNKRLAELTGIELDRRTAERRRAR